LKILPLRLKFMKYIISTLGCKVNQYETQAVEAMLRQRGHRPAAEGETADAVIVNTCAVTAESGRKSRQAVRHLEAAHPDAAVIVCGCWSQISAEEARDIGADVVFGTGDKHALVDAIERAVSARQSARFVDDPFRRMEFEELPAGAVSGRTRAMLKIEDGCVNFCTYCVIPFTRGRVRSLPLDAAARQARQLQDEGYRELVLTGIEIASYGVDLEGKPNLADCVETIAAAAPGLRLRLGSLEPTVITEEFVRRAAATGKVCPHFHLSLQSGCDKTLKNMNRKYDTAAFSACVERLERYFPGCALTADLITGFPGETLDDQAETLAFLRKCGFAQIHVFPYSVRPGTKAETMPGQVPKAEKARRAHEAQAVADELRADYLARQVGRVLQTLFETEENGVWTGHSDNYCTVTARGTDLRGLVKNVKISGVSGENLVGDLV